MLKIAFQGEEGAYSQAVAQSYFADAIETVAYSSFDQVFTAVTESACDLAFIPIENSLGGCIHRNYDLLERNQLHIVGEKIFRVRHSLIAQPGVELAQIKKVISHPQALAQCEHYLKQLGVETETWYDTAGAVKEVATHQDKSVAAIASSHAAEVYQMQVLAESIEDEPTNYTRFLVLSRHVDVAEDKQNKTSIVFTLESGGNKPNLLFRAIGVFALRDVNLSKIESRPDPKHAFQYKFYLDFDGGVNQDNCRHALDHLGEMAPMVRVLGSYARDEFMDD